jgi:hypothetical protein
MAIYLLTVQQSIRYHGAVHLSPGVNLRLFRDYPALGELKQADRLELRFPNGTARRTALLDYTVNVEIGDDGTVYGIPEIILTLPAGTSKWKIPEGTEVWWVEDALD